MEVHPQAEIWDGWPEANASRLLVYARQQTRCGSDAEDALQEALVEAWERSGGQAPPIRACRGHDPPEGDQPHAKLGSPGPASGQGRAHTSGAGICRKSFPVVRRVVVAARRSNDVRGRRLDP